MKNVLIGVAVLFGAVWLYRSVKIPGLAGSGQGMSPFTFPGTPSPGQNQQAGVNGWTTLNTLAQVSPEIIKATGEAFSGWGGGYGGGYDDNWGGSDVDPYYDPEPYDTYS